MYIKWEKVGNLLINNFMLIPVLEHSSVRDKSANINIC